MTLAMKAERLAAEIKQRAIVAYGVMISALDAGESVDCFAAAIITLAAGKPLTALASDRESLRLADAFRESIRESEALAVRAADEQLTAVVIDCGDRITRSRQAIAEIQRQVFGELE